MSATTGAGDTDGPESSRPRSARSLRKSGGHESRELVAVDERGSTTLADKVVEKIAARAVLDIPHAEGLSRRVVGREFGTPTVRAHAEIDGRVASLQLDLAVEYPASARSTTRGVREHVSERVAALCDLKVDHIDITVAVLRRAATGRKRVQ